MNAEATAQAIAHAEASRAEIIAKGLFAQTQRYFQHEIAKRDAQIAELIQLAKREPDLDAIAQRAALLVPKAKDGVNGKDASLDMDEVLRRVAQLIPTPQDGRDGKDASLDMDELVRRVAPLVPVPKDGTNGTNGKDGSNGIDGKSVAVSDLEPVITREVAKAVAALPIPRDGRDGKDGRDGESVPLETVTRLIAADVSKAVADLPKPKDGRDGLDGKHGLDGKNGERGQDGKDGDKAVVDVLDVVEAIKHDADAVEMLRGDPGPQGDKGDKGKDGDAGKDGKDGLNGKDGPSVTPEQLREVVDQRFAVWAIDFERTATDRQRYAIDSIPLPRDGRDGKDGRDGFGLDDFEFEADLKPDGRTVEFALRAGEREIRKAIKFAWPIDRGGWPSGGMKADKGDGVTYGGQFWIAQSETTATPGSSKDWRLAVRKGKDGRDAKDSAE